MASRSQTYQQRRKAAGLDAQVQHRCPSDINRLSSTQRGYNYKWQKYSTWRLKEYPLCVWHLAKGLLRTATITDHVIPHKGDMVLFWDPFNHQSMCKTCHDIKTATEDGAFGRAVKPKQEASAALC